MSLGRTVGCASALAALLAVVLGLILLYPNPAFGHVHQHGRFEVRSDRLIDPAIDQVLEDAERRLSTSGLLRPGERFRIYICNSEWRRWLFMRSRTAGGVAETLFTGNIYLRQINAETNRIVIPMSWGALLDEEDRPLSYFVAHEAAHVIQSRRYGRLSVWRSPRWLVEGHADLVAKGGAFDLSANSERLRRGDPLLGHSYARRGLYRRYHLMVAAALQNPGVSIDDLFAEPPGHDEALRLALTL